MGTTAPRTEAEPHVAEERIAATFVTLYADFLELRQHAGAMGPGSSRLFTPRTRSFMPFIMHLVRLLRTGGIVHNGHPIRWQG
jgi:hypothetical protein